MKSLFILTFLLVSIICKGQQHSQTPNIGTGIYKDQVLKFIPGSQIDIPLEVSVGLIKDTLFISPGAILNYIKIGNRVYKINSPTLTEIENRYPITITATGSGSGLNLFLGGKGTIDTCSYLSIPSYNKKHKLTTQK